MKSWLNLPKQNPDSNSVISRLDSLCGHVHDPDPMAKKKSSPKKAAAKKKAPATRVAKEPAAPRKKKAGIRYTDKEKAEIVQFVRDYDKRNKRGGQSAAVKKFGVTQITVAKWLKADGPAPARKKKATSKAGKNAPVAAAARPAPGGTVAILKRMLAIQEQIEALEGDYAGLKGQL